MGAECGPLLLSNKKGLVKMAKTMHQPQAQPSFSKKLGLWFEKNIYWLLLLPASLIFLVLTVFPLFYNVYISFYDYAFIQKIFDFIGVENYKYLFKDELFIGSILNTLRFLVSATTVEVMLGVGVAVLLNSKLVGKRIILPLANLPMMFPTMVITAIWAIIYDFEYGFFNNVLRHFGLEPLRWLSDPSIAMESVVLVDIWQWTPFVVLIVLAGLQSIPDYIYEAAQLDGASDSQQFRYITLPVIAFHLQLVILLRVIDGFRLFDKIYSLTSGGPGHTTETITMYIFKEGFRYFNLGYAAAASMVMLMLILAVSFIYTKRMWGEISEN